MYFRRVGEMCLNRFAGVVFVVGVGGLTANPFTWGVVMGAGDLYLNQFAVLCLVGVGALTLDPLAVRCTCLS